MSLFAGAVNTLSIVQERYFKPSPKAFSKVEGRGPDAWQFRPGSYFLLPFQEAFGRNIPSDFTIFLTIKPTTESEVGITIGHGHKKSVMSLEPSFIDDFCGSKKCPSMFSAIRVFISPGNLISRHG